MEIKIPKEVRQHKETISFGLSARQFFCAALGVGLAMGVCPDGIWFVGNRHSKSWRLTDVNYAASDEERRGIFLAYGGVLNSLPTDAATKSNNLVQEKYITLSIPQRKIEETRSYFRRVDGNLATGAVSNGPISEGDPGWRTWPMTRRS